MQHIIIQRLVYKSEECMVFDIPDDMEFCIYSDISERQKLWMSIYPFSEDVSRIFKSRLGCRVYRISEEFMCIVMGQMYFPESTPEENRFRNIVPVSEMNRRFREIVKEQFVRVCRKRMKFPETAGLYSELLSLCSADGDSGVRQLSEDKMKRVSEISSRLNEIGWSSYFTQFIAKPVELNLRGPFDAEVRCTVVEFNSFLGEEHPVNSIEKIDNMKMSVLYGDQPEYWVKDFGTEDSVSFVSSSPEIKEDFWNRVNEILAEVPKMC